MKQVCSIMSTIIAALLILPKLGDLQKHKQHLPPWISVNWNALDDVKCCTHLLRIGFARQPIKIVQRTMQTQPTHTESELLLLLQGSLEMSGQGGLEMSGEIWGVSQLRNRACRFEAETDEGAGIWRSETQMLQNIEIKLARIRGSCIWRHTTQRLQNKVQYKRIGKMFGDVWRHAADQWMQ